MRVIITLLGLGWEQWLPPFLFAPKWLLLLFFYEKVFILVYAFLEISIELPKFTGGHFNQREAHLLRF